MNLKTRDKIEVLLFLGKRPPRFSDTAFVEIVLNSESCINKSSAKPRYNIYVSNTSTYKFDKSFKKILILI